MGPATVSESFFLSYLSTVHMPRLSRVKILAGPLAALAIIQFTDLDPGNPMVSRMAGVAVWMAIWWLTEAVHLAVTSLIPFVLLPLLGIAGAKDVSSEYMDPVIFLFIGGFLISFAIERWNLHQRIALRILSIAGTRPENILMGVMLTAYLISMWISNTATVMMLLAAVLAIVHITDNPDHKNKGFHKALLIGLAYSATIGGMATLVGTPPNMVFMRTFTEAYPGNDEMNFTAWFAIGFPVSITMLVVCYFILRMLFIKKGAEAGVSKTYFIDSYRALGKMGYEQKWVTGLFSLTALLWFTRADIPFGSFLFPGWSNLFEQPAWITDSTVAIFIALLMFVIPSKTEKGTALLRWNDAVKLPFDIILLFGSGFALAMGFEVSGLSSWMAGHLSVLKGADPLFLILCLVALVCVISEFASNVASIQLMLPILIALQKELQIDPLLLMVPATLAASLGFMLPVATAPNTIVFGSRKIGVTDMARAGVLLDVAGILLITLIFYWIR
jgi:sodium-dependent dicarboxylate transporter 2/3/5